MNRNIWLGAAIIGALAPYFFFLQFMLDSGLNVSQFVAEIFANAPATGFTVDLFISSFVFWAWMFNDAKVRGVEKLWIFIALNLTIGLSCALPAYLYARDAPSE